MYNTGWVSVVPSATRTLAFQLETPGGRPRHVSRVRNDINLTLCKKKNLPPSSNHFRIVQTFLGKREFKVVTSYTEDPGITSRPKPLLTYLGLNSY